MDFQKSLRGGDFPLSERHLKKEKETVNSNNNIWKHFSPPRSKNNQHQQQQQQQQQHQNFRNRCNNNSPSPPQHHSNLPSHESPSSSSPPYSRHKFTLISGDRNSYCGSYDNNNNKNNNNAADILVPKPPQHPITNGNNNEDFGNRAPRTAAPRALNGQIRSASANPTIKRSHFASPSPQSRQGTVTTRLENAQKKLEESLRKHEVEYDRALRIRQLDLLRKKQQEEILQRQLQKEDEAAFRAQQKLLEQTQKQREKNLQKQTVAARHFALQSMHQQAILRKEDNEDAREMMWREQQLQAKEAAKQKALEKESFRNEAYFRTASQMEQRREYIIQRSENAIQAENKIKHLAETRARLREQNQLKQMKHDEARRFQEEQTNLRKIQQTNQELERFAVDFEVKKIGQAIMFDRRDLEVAVQRVKSSLKF